MKYMSFKKLLALSFVSITSLSLAMEDLRVSLLDDDELLADGAYNHKNNHVLTKNQKKLMDNIRNGKGITWLQIKVGDTNFEDENGNTPLMVAAEYGRSELVPGLLLFNYTSINKQNIDGETALMLAAMYGHKTIVGQLLGYATVVDVDITNRYGQTALDLAKASGHNEIVRMLKVFKAKQNKYGLGK